MISCSFHKRLWQATLFYLVFYPLTINAALSSNYVILSNYLHRLQRSRFRLPWNNVLVYGGHKCPHKNPLSTETSDDVYRLRLMLVRVDMATIQLPHWLYSILDRVFISQTIQKKTFSVYLNKLFLRNKFCSVHLCTWSSIIWIIRLTEGSTNT